MFVPLPEPLVSSPLGLTVKVAFLTLAAKISVSANVATAVYEAAVKSGTLALPTPFLTSTLMFLPPTTTLTIPVKVALVVILTTATSPSAILSTLIVNAGSTLTAGFAVTLKDTVWLPSSYLISPR